MRTSLEKCQDEMRRAEHLIYVSLKYTRTVDIMKHIIDRMINASDCMLDLLFKYAKKKRKIKEIPEKPGPRCSKLKEIFEDDDVIKNFVDFYMFLRKLSRASYTASREFRRHVTMTAIVDNEQFEFNIDKIYEFNDKLKNFIDYVEVLTGLKKNE